MAKEMKLVSKWPRINTRYALRHGDATHCLQDMPRSQKIDLVVTSPPYNMGKEYEEKKSLKKYLRWQEDLIEELAGRLSPNASVCWQVGNYVQNGHIEPLDIHFHPIFTDLGFSLRNRIVWRFGHGLHSKRRFSGRYEVVMWYTKSDEYHFDLDAVRVPSKYPGKRAYKGPNSGEYSGNPKGKNPEDVWDIPNVKGNHKEKTEHPCQFPVGLAQRLILALSKKGNLVYDPFAGVGTTGVASILEGRRFWGSELSMKYCKIAKNRIDAAMQGKAIYRQHDMPIYDHSSSPLSIPPEGFQA